MLLAYLLNQVVDELGRELRRGSDNVRAPLQAIVYLMEEPLPARAPPPPELQRTFRRRLPEILWMQR